MSQKKWTEEKKRHARQMRYKVEEITRLEKTICELENERRRFRAHASERFQWWTKLLNGKDTPSLPWLIEHDAKFLQSVSYFTW